MAMNKNGKQLKMHRIPPQPRRKSLFQTAGEVSKPFLITIITFVAILALLLLLLFSKQFVGKALYTGGVNTAGLVLGKVAEDEAFKAIVKANIEASQTRTIGFKLDLPEEMSCTSLSEIKGLLPAPLLEVKECKPAPNLGGQVIYTYTTMGSPHTGELNLAEISFKPLAAGSYDLKFSQFEMLDEKNNKISLGVLNPSIEVQKKLAPKLPPGSACAKDNDCSEGYVCKNSMCAAKQVEVQKKPAPQPPGGPCVSDDDCSEGNECKSGMCAAKQAAVQQPSPAAQPPGVSCKLDADCISGYECKSGVCAAKPAAVQPPAPEELPSPQQCALDSDCLSGYECKNAVCTVKSVAQLPGSGAMPVAPVQGKKVILTEIAPANNVFSTLITATEDFTSEVMVYTVLYGVDNKVLSLQSEKIVNGLKKGATYMATVNYPQSNVKKKTVLLYDVEADPQVHALLEKTYVVS